MSKQRLILATGFAVLLLSIVGVFSYAHFRNRFNEDVHGPLELGMTLAEVEAILGGPPNDYGYGEICGWSFDGSLQFCCMPGREKIPSVRTWTGQRTVLCIDFGDAQKAKWIGHRGILRVAPDETWIAKARRFCGF